MRLYTNESEAIPFEHFLQQINLRPNNFIHFGIFSIQPHNQESKGNQMKYSNLV